LNNDHDKYSVARRSILFSGDKINLEIGNFTNNSGLGLGIGGYDYRPVNYDYDHNDIDNLISPDNSYYNGLKINYDNRITGIYSAKKYYDNIKSLYAGVYENKINNMDYGITYSTTVLKSDNYSKSINGASVFLRDIANNTQAEAGYFESGFGGNLLMMNQSYNLRLWYYADGFINLNSSGYANPDYVSYTDNDSELSFKQPQQGESGLYFKKLLYYNKFNLAIASEIWQKNSKENLSYENYIKAEYQYSDDFKTYLNIKNRTTSRYERYTYYGGFRFVKLVEVISQVSFCYNNGEINHDKSNYFIYINKKLNSGVSLRGRFRWDFNGNPDFFIEESTKIIREIFMKLTYRYNKGASSNPGQLYFILESIW